MGLVYFHSFSNIFVILCFKIEVKGKIFTRVLAGNVILYQNVLGEDRLPILSSKRRMAYLDMVKAHESGHLRTASDTLFRSCRYAWIHQGRKLAERVI